MGVLLTLDVNAEDMGKIIGRSGNTAKAIRTLLRVVGMKHDARVNLKINEPEGGARSVGADATEMDAGVGETAEQEAKSLDQAIDDLPPDWPNGRRQRGTLDTDRPARMKAALCNADLRAHAEFTTIGKLG